MNHHDADCSSPGPLINTRTSCLLQLEVQRIAPHSVPCEAPEGFHLCEHIGIACCACIHFNSTRSAKDTSLAGTSTTGSSRIGRYLPAKATCSTTTVVLLWLQSVNSAIGIRRHRCQRVVMPVPVACYINTTSALTVGSSPIGIPGRDSPVEGEASNASQVARYSFFLWSLSIVRDIRTRDSREGGMM